jgi:hypothetical protein
LSKTSLTPVTSRAEADLLVGEIATELEKRGFFDPARAPGGPFEDKNGGYHYVSAAMEVLQLNEHLGLAARRLKRAPDGFLVPAYPPGGLERMIEGAERATTDEALAPASPEEGRIIVQELIRNLDVESFFLPPNA